MADETEDPDIAAARLEAALDRIAKRTAEKQVAEPQPVAPIVAAMPDEPYIAELADRLDSLIDRLRGALATK